MKDSLPYKTVAELYNSDRPYSKLVEEFQCTKTQISNIKRKRTYKQFTDWLDWMKGRFETSQMKPVIIKPVIPDEVELRSTKTIETKKPTKIDEPVDEDLDEEEDNWMNKVVEMDLDGKCYDEFGEYLGTKKAGQRG